MKSLKLKISGANTILVVCDKRCIKRIKRKPHIKINVGIIVSGHGYPYYICRNNITEVNNVLFSPIIDKVYSLYSNNKKNNKLKNVEFIPLTLNHTREVYVPFKSWKDVAKFKLKYQ